MGSSDHLNSARRAAIVFVLLAIGALGAGLAVSASGDAPVALGASPKLPGQIHRRPGEIFGPRRLELQLALYAPERAPAR